MSPFRILTFASENGTFNSIVAPGFDAQVNTGDISVVASGSPNCTYSIGSAIQTFPAEGGTGSPILVSAPAGCTWTAVSNNTDWISITSGSSGTGSGTVEFSVLANTGALRTGTLTVAGQTFTVTQAAKGCTYQITPLEQSFPASGGTGAVTVSTDTGCDWMVASTVDWIRITSPAQAAGSGTVEYVVAENQDLFRAGTLDIAGKVVTIRQARSTTTRIVTRTIDFSEWCILPLGTIWRQDFADGARLEVRCSIEGFKFPSYKMVFVSASGVEARIAQCLFSGGGNSASYKALVAVDGTPLSLVSTHWENLDGESNDGLSVLKT